MLETFNTLLSDQNSGSLASRILWRDIGSGPDITAEEFHQQLAALRTKIAGSEAERWLLYSNDPCHFLPGFLALLSLRKKVVISASIKPEWLQGVSSGFDAILCDEIVVLDEAGAGSQPKTYVDFALDSSSARPWSPCFTGSEEIVFFTSGSTGQPKAIEKTLLALTNEITTLANTFGTIIEGSLFVASVSHLHIYGLLFKLLLPLFVNGTSVRQQIEYPEQLLGLGEKSAQNSSIVFVSSPTFLSRLDPRLPPVATSAVFSSGGPLSFNAAQASRQYFTRLPIEVYGSTETGGIGFRQQTEPATAWRPFAGAELSQNGENTELRSPNMPGQPACVLDDQLEFLPDGRFLMKGRKDRIVKIAEKRVSLTEIEKFLEAQPSISECVAVPIYARREVIGCAVVLSPEGLDLATRFGQQVLIQSWKTAMQKRFEAVTVPRHWRIVLEIPVNTQSKIDHHQLFAEFTGNQDFN